MAVLSRSGEEAPSDCRWPRQQQSRL